ncbi:MAG TPA: pilus assembly protein TadG-related protein, partial [Gemmataceae bacterium]|nr:pilus assembly protein TadG-related protein [Gemmataceae bacterium]
MTAGRTAAKNRTAAYDPEDATMLFHSPHASRRGTVVPYLALTIVALAGFLALAIDVGMLAIAKAQAQNAADLAALAAMRTVNGNSTGTYNQGTATANAQNVLTYNSILGQSIQS